MNSWENLLSGGITCHFIQIASKLALFSSKFYRARDRMELNSSKAGYPKGKERGNEEMTPFLADSYSQFSSSTPIINTPPKRNIGREKDSEDSGINKSLECSLISECTPQKLKDMVSKCYIFRLFW